MLYGFVLPRYVQQRHPFHEFPPYQSVGVALLEHSHTLQSCHESFRRYPLRWLFPRVITRSIDSIFLHLDVQQSLSSSRHAKFFLGLPCLAMRECLVRLAASSRATIARSSLPHHHTLDNRYLLRLALMCLRFLVVNSELTLRVLRRVDASPFASIYLFSHESNP